MLAWLFCQAQDWCRLPAIEVSISVLTVNRVSVNRA